MCTSTSSDIDIGGDDPEETLVSLSGCCLHIHALVHTSVKACLPCCKIIILVKF